MQIVIKKCMSTSQYKFQGIKRALWTSARTAVVGVEGRGGVGRVVGWRWRMVGSVNPSMYSAAGLPARPAIRQPECSLDCVCLQVRPFTHPPVNHFRMFVSAVRSHCTFTVCMSLRSASPFLSQMPRFITGNEGSRVSLRLTIWLML